MTSWASKIRPVHIANRSWTSWWIRGPLAFICAVVIALPQVAIIAGYLIIRDYTRGLPETPNLTLWAQNQPRTSFIRSADGTYAFAPRSDDS